MFNQYPYLEYLDILQEEQLLIQCQLELEQYLECLEQDILQEEQLLIQCQLELEQYLELVDCTHTTIMVDLA